MKSPTNLQAWHLSRAVSALALALASATGCGQYAADAPYGGGTLRHTVTVVQRAEPPPQPQPIAVTVTAPQPTPPVVAIASEPQPSAASPCSTCAEPDEDFDPEEALFWQAALLGWMWQAGAEEDDFEEDDDEIGSCSVCM
jgi:hypothetical protein